MGGLIARSSHFMRQIREFLLAEFLIPRGITIVCRRYSPSKEQRDIQPQRDRLAHGEPPLFASFESDHARVGESLNELPSGGVGITRLVRECA
jgi:hypothetical protein